jgi:hypothetical protein
LRVHTTNDNTGDVRSKACKMWIIILSQILFVITWNPLSEDNRNHVATASIKKTHSQCQREANASYPPEGEIRFFIPGA